MMKNNRGAFRIFQAFGIKVWLHWSWFLLAVYEVENRKDAYSSAIWSVAEYLALFCIVLLHEFGHSLACKQVGGQADEIILWPLGGLAFVRPPNRPGATLWSIAAGPLVNVLLAPVLFGLEFLASRFGLYDGNPDFHRFVRMVILINLFLLVFNMLPIYPLDGGQILRSLLWFVIGSVRSLYVVVVIGCLGGIAMGIYALEIRQFWFCILAAFVLVRCWSGFKQAKILGKINQMARHEAYACPACGEAPFAGAFWTCNICQKRFDTFAAGARCPQCKQEFVMTGCPSCQRSNPLEAWRVIPPPPPP